MRNYGPGSISTKAKARAAALPPLPKEQVAKRTVQGEAAPKKETLLNTIMAPRRANDQDQKSAVDRLNQEEKLREEVGGRRKR